MGKRKSGDESGQTGLEEGVKGLSEKKGAGPDEAAGEAELTLEQEAAYRSSVYEGLTLEDAPEAGEQKNGAGDEDAAGEAKGTEGALYDEWLTAKKMGVKPRFVVRWRRGQGVEGLDFVRARGFEGGAAYERIGLTREGADRAAKAFGFRGCDPTGAELVRRGVQAEVKKVPGNARLVICERVAARELGTLATVTVRSNTEFRPGDEFVAENAGQAGLIKKGGGWLPGEW